MHVVHISKVTGIAGSEGHLLTLLPSLAYSGITITMIVLDTPDRAGGEFCSTMQSCGVSTIRIPIRSHFDLVVVRRLAHELRRLRPDVVHTHLVHADIFGQIAAVWAKTPVVISSRHNDNPFRRGRLFGIMNRWLSKKTAAIIAISNALFRFVTEVEGFPQEKVHTIHYGLSPVEFPLEAGAMARSQYGIAADVPLIGMFGRLIEQKGVDVLLEAFAHVLNTHSIAKLIIVGDGKLREALEGLAEQLGIMNSVLFTGWVANDQVKKLMLACDVVVMPSRWEGFGLVALEAMNCARPVIASRVSALPEIILDGETGILVSPDDVPALTSAITALLDDRDKALMMGQAGNDRLVQEFSVEKMVRATSELYREVALQFDGRK